jgi:hypothetical protein
VRPIAGLRVDWETGEGAVVLPERFLQEDALFRADVLKDWLGYFVDLYRETIHSDLTHVFAGIQTEVVRKIVEGRDTASAPAPGAKPRPRRPAAAQGRGPADDADMRPDAQVRLSGCARHPEAGLTALYDGETGVLTIQCRACSQAGPSFLVAFPVQSRNT